ncbi:coiled-coil domain-containing protein 112-like [Styela clava]
MEDMKGTDECGRLNEKTKKQKFLRELEQIKFQKNIVEKERAGFIYDKRGESYKHFQDVEKSLSHELSSERIKLEQQLKKMKEKVDGFQRELKQVKATPEFVARLKTTMEDIESTIGFFKQKQRETFETLMIAEKETEQELMILEGKIEAMKSTKAHTSAKSIKQAVKQQMSNLPKEIHDFEVYVAQNGGLQGGWDDYDHGAFLRIRDKFKANRSFIPAAARQIPGRSQKDVEDHEKWFTHFIELKRRKKEAIEVWRRNKEEKENCRTDPDKDDEELQELREKEEKEIRKRLQHEREIKKEQLKIWKTQKLEKQRQEEERKMEEEKLREAAERKKRKEKEEAMKPALEALRQKKENNERLRWMEEFEAEQREIERQQEVRQKISSFQSRDRVALKLKQTEQMKRDGLEEMKKKKLEKTKLKVEVERDPTRLYRMTEGWVNRTNAQSETIATNNGVARMPHRAVPSWRQNL